MKVWVAYIEEGVMRNTYVYNGNYREVLLEVFKKFTREDRVCYIEEFLRKAYTPNWTKDHLRMNPDEFTNDEIERFFNDVYALTTKTYRTIIWVSIEEANVENLRPARLNRAFPDININVCD